MADRDLAIKDIIQSAFGYAGQKCSACSLAICHAEIYDNLRFRQQLCDAAASLAAGSAWDLATKLNPLIRGANPTLLRGLTELDEGEEWLLQPKQDPKNPNLWSPGIKIGVKKGSFTHQNEFFGPVLALMRAETIQEAIDLANGTPYGLTSGIHTLDEREQKEWMEKIEAGNCYINRGITGAIVHRQPFGGTKESSFGRGAKAGGPNYLIQLMHAKEIALPQEQEALPENLRAFSANVEPLLATLEEKAIWNSSLGSYSYAWNNYFKKDQELSFLRGQDNFLRYLPYKKMIIRLCEKDSLIDSARVLAAAITCNLAIEFSMPKLPEQLSFLTKIVKVVEEEDEQLVDRLRLEKQIPKVRFLSPPRIELRKALLELGCRLADLPVLSHGRLELLNYLREVSFSVDYHRYGNLGEREGEKR
jgi:RHH-type proline utilization regulon transcriptional repressor/proline dehydrogenase/delta 1-pyrroline-5-carboxylate dehydrogenase